MDTLKSTVLRNRGLGSLWLRPKKRFKKCFHKRRTWINFLQEKIWGSKRMTGEKMLCVTDAINLAILPLIALSRLMWEEVEQEGLQIIKGANKILNPEMGMVQREKKGHFKRQEWIIIRNQMLKIPTRDKSTIEYIVA